MRVRVGGVGESCGNGGYEIKELFTWLYFARRSCISACFPVGLRRRDINAILSKR